MNTYFVFWKKVDGEITELEGRSVQASDVSISDGKLKFWRDFDIKHDNRIFSVPLEDLVEFYKEEPTTASDNMAKEATRIIKTDRDFIGWITKEEKPLTPLQKLNIAVRELYNREDNPYEARWRLQNMVDCLDILMDKDDKKAYLSNEMRAMYLSLINNRTEEIMHKVGRNGVELSNISSLLQQVSLDGGNDLSRKVAELALKVEGIKRQKALDEREKELTFFLFELNEQRLNEKARKRKEDRQDKASAPFVPSPKAKGRIHPKIVDCVKLDIQKRLKRLHRAAHKLVR